MVAHAYSPNTFEAEAKDHTLVATLSYIVRLNLRKQTKQKPQIIKLYKQMYIFYLGAVLEIELTDAG